MIKDVPVGARYLGFGFRSLASHVCWWPLLIGPVLINAVLFAGFVLLMGALSGRFLLAAIPETWWGAILYLVLIMTSVIFTALLSIPLFTLLGTVIAAPFYDKLAARAYRLRGDVLPELSWREEFLMGLRQCVLFFGWYLFVQGALVLVLLLPVVGGPFSISVLGFAAGCVFLSVEYLTFSPYFRRWGFANQRRWCMDHVGLLVGFGAAIAACLVIPGLNVFVPPAAVVGGVRLLEDQEHRDMPTAHFRLSGRNK